MSASGHVGVRQKRACAPILRAQPKSSNGEQKRLDDDDRSRALIPFGVPSDYSSKKPARIYSLHGSCFRVHCAGESRSRRYRYVVRYWRHRYDIAIRQPAQAWAITHDSGDRLIVAGRNRDDMLGNSIPTLARYLPDGTLDTTFGDAGTGIVTITPPGGLSMYGQLYAVALDSKGRIVVGGDVGIDTPAGPSYAFTLMRYLADGTLDRSFASNGTLETVILASEAGSGIQSLVIDSKDRIVASGSSDSFTGGSGVIVRYDEDGGLDHSFAKTGMVFPNSSGNPVFGNVALDHSGRIVLVGYNFDPITSDPETILGRYLDNGEIDTGFGPDGSGFSISLDVLSNRCAIDDSDRIVVAGGSNVTSTFALERFGADGLPDSSFGVDGTGIVSTDEYGDPFDVHRVAFDNDGRLVATQQLFGNFEVFRFTADGVADSAFGSGGIAPGPGSDLVYYSHGDMDIDSANHLTLVGWSDDGTPSQFSLVRFEN
ncbi:MAG TPA: hypothetical protein VF132_00375 [Rudaea sp.]